MAAQSAFHSVFGSFNRVFWVVNFFELFERGAFYGTMAVLGVHVIDNILAGDPHAAAMWGVLYGVLVLLLDFIPIFSAALAEKVGYRPMLFVAFLILLSGYAILFMVQPDQLAMLVLSLTMVGVGAGLFKPIVSASIAHVTKTEERNQAYSIYYWMINLGAFIIPLTVGFAFREPAVYRYVFALASGLVACNVALLLLYYKSPVEANHGLSVASAFKRILPALQDKKFVTLLLIYSGFWFMYTYGITFLPVYMVQYGRMPTWVTLGFIATVNPGTIILLGPFLGKAIEKYRSLDVMMAGIVIYCVGMIINGFSDSSALFFTGIVIFSIGEFITHPGFIAYVSKIAPKDKIAIYMASIFLATGLGSVLGGFVHGLWYDHYVSDLSRPRVYIGLVVAVGLLTLAGFMLYNLWLIVTTRKEDPTRVEPPSVWTNKAALAMVVLLIPATVGGSFLAGTSQMVAAEGEEGADFWDTYASADFPLNDLTGSAQEGETVDELVQIDVPNVVELTLTLTWTDEADAGVRYNNEPDQFRLSVTPPNGTAKTGGPTANAQGGTGTMSVTFDFPLGKREFFNGTGQWAIGVELVTAGDQVLWRPGIGLFDRADTGNAYTLTLECTYMEKS